MQRSAFICLSPDVWVLGAPIAAQRRRALLRSPPPFEEIVRGLHDNVSIASMRTEQRLNWSGPMPLPWRVVVRLNLRQREGFFDLFHNSAAGVRAQCLHGIGLGDMALDYARDALRGRAFELAKVRRNGAISFGDVQHSLNIDYTKVWVHQGLWVRRARTDDRHLRISKWETNENSESKKIRTLVRYGSKAPQWPAAIDVIGGWVHPAQRVDGKPPGLRAKEIHSCGFT